MTLSLDVVLIWVLTSVRLIAMFTAAPFFGHLSFPRRARVAFALVLAWSMAPESELQFAGASQGQIAGWVFAEAAIGLSIGILAQLIFSAFGILGMFISIQGGLGAARVLDPSSGASSAAMAAALQWAALIVYLVIGGHHLLLIAVSDSFELLPMGSGAPPPGALMESVLTGGRLVYNTAMKMSLPVTVAMLVGNVALGLLGRSVSQLNLMTLQLPAHIGGMLLLLAVGAQAIAIEMAKVLSSWTAGLAPAVAGVP